MARTATGKHLSDRIRAERLAALREVRAFVKAVEDCPSCNYTLAKIDALIKREEEGR